MVRKIVSGIVLLGVLWGLGTWFGGGNPMPSPAWWDSAQEKVSSLIDFSGDTAREKLPDGGIDIEQFVPSPAQENPGGGK